MGNFDRITGYVDSLNDDMSKILNNFIGEYLVVVDNTETPDPFAGIYNKDELFKVFLRIRGVILVSHSEIQSFLEFLGKEYIKEAHRKYTQGEITEMFLFFLTTPNDKVPSANSYKNPSDIANASNQNASFEKFNGIHERYEYIHNCYCETLKNNYGVKEKNIFAIFNPLGITYEELRKMRFFSIIHEYGNIRGDFAHEAVSESKYLPSRNALSGRILDVKKTETMINEIVALIKNELIPLLNEKVKKNSEDTK